MLHKIGEITVPSKCKSVNRHIPPLNTIQIGKLIPAIIKYEMLLKGSFKMEQGKKILINLCDIYVNFSYITLLLYLSQFTFQMIQFQLVF